jgi:hypothetical protein
MVSSQIGGLHPDVDLSTSIRPIHIWAVLMAPSFSMGSYQHSPPTVSLPLLFASLMKVVSLQYLTATSQRL